MSMTRAKNIGLCPECGAEIRFKKMPYIGQIISCRRCDTQLEVIQKSPVELQWAEDAWDEEPQFEPFNSSKSNRRRQYWD